MAETPTTELEAVNEMLAAIGEAPVNTLTPPLTAEVQVAVDTLRNTSRKVQLVGWWFNEEEDYLISLDVNSKAPIPGNALNIDLTVEESNKDLVQRGGFLFDKVSHSFTLTAAPKCTITFFLPWTDLPEAAREYIKIKAARIYQQRTVGSGDHYSFTKADEAEAYATMLELEAENGDYTIFDNYDIYSIIARRRPVTKAF
jgi:hypothetical protein